MRRCRAWGLAPARRTAARHNVSASSARRIHVSIAPPLFFAGGGGGGGGGAGSAFTVMITSSTARWFVSSVTASSKRSASLAPLGRGAVKVALSVVAPASVTAVPCNCVH